MNNGACTVIWRIIKILVIKSKVWSLMSAFDFAGYKKEQGHFDHWAVCYAAKLSLSLR